MGRKRRSEMITVFLAWLAYIFGLLVLGPREEKK